MPFHELIEFVNYTCQNTWDKKVIQEIKEHGNSGRIDESSKEIHFLNRFGKWELDYSLEKEIIPRLNAIIRQSWSEFRDQSRFIIENGLDKNEFIQRNLDQLEKQISENQTSNFEFLKPLVDSVIDELNSLLKGVSVQQEYRSILQIQEETENFSAPIKWKKSLNGKFLGRLYSVLTQHALLDVDIISYEEFEQVFFCPFLVVKWKSYFFSFNLLIFNFRFCHLGFFSWKRTAVCATTHS